MNRRGIRAGTLLSAVAALGMAVAACGSATPTLIRIHVTLSPAAGTPTLAPAQSLVATATPTTAAKPTPTAPTAPAESATPGPTDTPFVSFTPPPVGTPVPSSYCTGSVDNQAFLTDAANKLPFGVYCAVLPTGWYLAAPSKYELPNGGQLLITYHGPGGAVLTVNEGAFCTTSVSACTPRDHPLETAMFSDQNGGLVALGPTAADGFAIYVNGGSSKAYEINCTGLTQAKFVAYAKAMVKVAKA